MKNVNSFQIVKVQIQGVALQFRAAKSTFKERGANEDKKGSK